MQFKFYGSEIISLMNARLQYNKEKIEYITNILPEKRKIAKEKNSMHYDMQVLDHEQALIIHKNNVKKFEFYVKHIVDDNIYYLSEEDLITYQLLVLD